MFVGFAISAVCLSAPVDGPIAHGFEPTGRYSGHWGVDYAVALGSPVRAAVTGRVSFAGQVGGMLSVTIEPVPGLKVSTSYLSETRVRRGTFVRKGQVVGLSGTEDGLEVVHFSVRIAGRYVDPVGQMGCRSTDITRALRLITPPQPYPRSRAHRDTRRNVRPDSYRASPCRRDSPASGRARSGSVHAGRRSLAEG